MLNETLQKLIAQGKKEGMIRAADLNAQLEKMQLTPEKIEEIYDRFEAMNIQIVTAELELVDDALLLKGGDIDLNGLDEEDLIDPVDATFSALLSEILTEALDTLTEREADILRMRYGLCGTPQTLEEVGRHFGVTRERIRQIEGKALRLRHPTRAKKLRDFAI